MKSIAVAASLLLLAAQSHAAVIEIPLPALLGSYQNTARSATIVLPAQPSVIYGASLRVSGSTVLGQLDCFGEPPGIQPQPMDLWGEMHDGSGRYWFVSDHSAMQAGGAFTWTQPFEKTPASTTWAFLMDGVGDITLNGFDPYTWCNVRSSVSGGITEAVFIIDAEFPVAVEQSTWGKIKALYR
jgi:hypothetical protein